MDRTEDETVDEVGRRAAFRDVVEPEIAVMLRVARSLTGHDQDAEDLVQDALVRAFRAIDRFDGRHPRAWLLTIVRNTHLNLVRKRRPTVVEDLDLPGSRPAFGPTAVASAEDEVVAGVVDADLRAAVAALDPRFRSVLVLVDVHDLSYAEAAATLGVPVGTVMSRLSRARSRVRAALPDHRATRPGAAPTPAPGGTP